MHAPYISPYIGLKSQKQIGPQSKRACSQNFHKIRISFQHVKWSATKQTVMQCPYPEGLSVLGIKVFKVALKTAEQLSTHAS
jgi:hypothetical protein